MSISKEQIKLDVETWAWRQRQNAYAVMPGDLIISEHSNSGLYFNELLNGTFNVGDVGFVIATSNDDDLIDRILIVTNKMQFGWTRASWITVIGREHGDIWRYCPDNREDLFV